MCRTLVEKQFAFNKTNGFQILLGSSASQVSTDTKLTGEEVAVNVAINVAINTRHHEEVDCSLVCGLCMSECSSHQFTDRASTVPANLVV